MTAPTALPPMDVTLCTLNAVHSVRACIEAVRREVPVARLIVVDGGSTDGTLDVVRSFPETELHIRPDLGLGPSRAFAFSLVRTEHFLQIDSDVILREGWGALAAEQFGAADVLEFGTCDHYAFDNPPAELVGTRKYEARAFFFVNIMRRDAVAGVPLDLRNMEDELARRAARARGQTWRKTGIVHADQYSRPVRYVGRSIVKLARARAYESWVFEDEGAIAGLDGAGVGAAIVGALRAGARECLSPLVAAWPAVANPLRVTAAYLRGWRRGVRGRPAHEAAVGRVPPPPSH